MGLWCCSQKKTLHLRTTMTELLWCFNLLQIVYILYENKSNNLASKIDCHIVLSGCKRSRMLKLLIGDFRRYKIEGVVQEILSFRFEPSFSHFRIHFSRCVYRFIYFYLPALIYHGCHIQPLSQFCRLSSALQISVLLLAICQGKWS